MMINVFDRKLTFSFLNASDGFLRLRPQIHTSSSKSLADITRDRYGSDTLKLFRILERTTLKYYKTVADLQFLKSCRDANLISIFLRFKLSNNRLQRSSEVTKAHRRLLDVEIRSKERCIKQLSNNLDKLSIQQTNLKTITNFVDYFKYRLTINESVNSQRSLWHSTHQKKFINLRTTSRSDLGLLDHDSVIINLSSYVLSDVEN